MATATKTKPKAAAKKKAKNKDDFWRIDGVTYHRSDLPKGVDHPVPSRIEECPPVDVKILARCRTKHTSPAYPKGFKVDDVLTFTNIGFSLCDMVRLVIEEERLDPKKPKGKFGQPNIIRVKVERGALQKIYYRSVTVTDDPKRPGLMLRIPGALLPEPLWSDPSQREGIPVGREDKYRTRVLRNSER